MSESVQVLALVRDLFFGERIKVAAQQLQRGVQVISSAAQAAAAVQAAAPALVIVDLTVPGLDLPQLVQAAHGLPRPAQVVAFGPHMDKAAHQAARAAGCDQVLANSQLTRDLGELLLLQAL